MNNDANEAWLNTDWLNYNINAPNQNDEGINLVFLYPVIEAGSPSCVVPSSVYVTFSLATHRVIGLRSSTSATSLPVALTVLSFRVYRIFHTYYTVTSLWL